MLSAPNSSRVVVAALVLVLVLSTNGVARADITEQCIADAELAQRARIAGHLQEAAKAAIACGRSTCPKAIANDCKSWLAEIQGVQPSIVLRATAGGSDVTDVTVTLDGKIVRTALDGRELQVDPGEHTLLFERTGSASVTQKILVVVGERARVTDVAFVDAAPASTWHVPTASWIVGGVGIVVAGIGAGLWISGRSDHSSLVDQCGSQRLCTASDESGAKTKLVVGDVLVLAGAAAVVGAVVIAITNHANFSAHVDGTSAKLGFTASF